jgi:hypothetical protein
MLIDDFTLPSLVHQLLLPELFENIHSLKPIMFMGQRGHPPHLLPLEPLSFPHLVGFSHDLFISFLNLNLAQAVPVGFLSLPFLLVLLIVHSLIVAH